MRKEVLGECDRLTGQTPELLLSLQLFATAVLVNADQTCKHKPAALTLIPVVCVELVEKVGNVDELRHAVGVLVRQHVLVQGLDQLFWINVLNPLYVTGPALELGAAVAIEVVQDVVEVRRNVAGLAGVEDVSLVQPVLMAVLLGLLLDLVSVLDTHTVIRKLGRRLREVAEVAGVDRIQPHSVLPSVILGPGPVARNRLHSLEVRRAQLA